MNDKLFRFNMSAQDLIRIANSIAAVSEDGKEISNVQFEIGFNQFTTTIEVSAGGNRNSLKFRRSWNAMPLIYNDPFKKYSTQGAGGIFSYRDFEWDDQWNCKECGDNISYHRIEAHTEHYKQVGILICMDHEEPCKRLEKNKRL